jgi:cytochrome c-type biogenesis protein CcmH/NrfF
LLLACLAVAVASAACGVPDDPAHRIQDVERRILAPCCKRQTLEDHDSDIARTLRNEIQARVTAGEQTQVIEDDIVHRYGEDIRAMPRGVNPRGSLGIVVAIILALGVWVLIRLLRRSRSQARVAAAASPAVAGAALSDADAVHAQQIDDELLELD